MYSTCLFCHQSLGSNEAIEHFPVGARLAFDGAKGRLWVVCTKCGRWNLSPVEERWEAIEEAEREYRDTAKRVSTDNIGLARLTDGTDLIRIGSAKLPEFAAWRYGDVFGRRRNRAMIMVMAAGAVTAVASRFGERALGLAFGATIGLQVALGLAVGVSGALRVRVPITDAEGQRRSLSQGEAWSAKYAVHPGTGDLQLTVTARHGHPFDTDARRSYERIKSVTRFAFDDRYALTLNGKCAHRALSNLITAANVNGGDTKQVKRATAIVEELRTPAQLLWKLPAMAERGFFRSTGPKDSLINLQRSFRLALEMSLHEDDERRAMDGELAALEARWREADEIAGIADNLMLSSSTEQRVVELRNEVRKNDH